MILKTLYLFTKKILKWPHEIIRPVGDVKLEDTSARVSIESMNESVTVLAEQH